MYYSAKVVVSICAFVKILGLAHIFKGFAMNFVVSNSNNVTGEQPLKLAHSLLGYAVGMTDINRPGWPITRKQTHRNKF